MTTATKPLTSLETANLIRAGLGRKQLNLFEGDGSRELHSELSQAWRMEEAMNCCRLGGWDEVFVHYSSPSDGYSVSYWREVLRQAKVYFRPIQKLEPEELDVTAAVCCSVPIPIYCQCTPYMSAHIHDVSHVCTCV